MGLALEIWGIVAGLITTSGFIPQIAKGYQTKKLDDLSYMLNALIGVGMFMWLIYGIAIRSVAVIFANVVGVSLNIALILMKYRYGKSRAND